MATEFTEEEIQMLDQWVNEFEAELDEEYEEQMEKLIHIIDAKPPE